MSKREIFFVGLMFGFLIGFAIWVFKPPRIWSNKKINPEIYLKTDGKIIDTIYIYKE